MTDPKDLAAELESMGRQMAEMTDSMNKMMGVALRMQTLMLEDANRMLAELAALSRQDASDQPAEPVELKEAVR